LIFARFLVLACVTFWLSRTLPYYYSNQWIMMFIELPGTILHEGMHWLVAAMLQGSPSTFSIWPTFDSYGSMNTLGHVHFAPNWYNAASVGAAPFLLMPLTFFITALCARTWNPLRIVLGLWFASTGWLSSTPSSQDFWIANSYPLSWLFALPFLLGVSYITYRVTRKTIRI